MKRGNHKFSFIQRLLALVLVAAMAYSFLPTDALADNSTATQAAAGTTETVSDPQTLTRPTDIYGDNTQNAGKVTVGKSVSDGAVTLDEATFTPADGNFLVTISQSAQVMALASESSQPIDVVFVLDTSGSMDDNDRAENMVTAANSAIKAILEANPNNRVGVVAFSSAGNYGGGTSGGSAANILSDLAHYDDSTTTGSLAQSNHLQWVDEDGNTATGTSTASADSNSRKGGNQGGGNQGGGNQGGGNQNNYIYIAGRSTTTSGSSTVLNNRRGYNGGTNIQAGIALGASLLTKATTTADVDGKTVTRMPFLIVLSDGAPTFTLNAENWYEATSGNEQGPGDGSYAGNGFLTALTASYYKNQITAHYYGEKATEANRCYVYTVGVQMTEALADITMDPSKYFGAGATATNNDYYSTFRSYWESYEKGESFNILVNRNNNNNVNYTVTKASIDATKASVNSLAYNDKYYNATDISQLAQIFKDLVSTIQQKAMSSPTRVDEAFTDDFSGYVTFTDPLGEYMEVKNMYGLIADGAYYSGAAAAEALFSNADSAVNANLKNLLKQRLALTNSSVDVDTLINQALASSEQAYYTSATDYDNSIVWWGNGYTPTGEEDEQVQCLGWAADDSVAYIQGAKAAGSIPADADYVCRSYFFYGDPNGEGDFLYFVVRVQRSLTAPYQQTVVISAPASLLSVEKVLITEETDDSGNKTYTANVQEAEPARVVYEVGLRSDINAQNVAQILAADAANGVTYTTEAPVAETDGTTVGVPNVVDDTYYFYTNDWDRSQTAASHHRAMTHATFDAAADNPFYTYQEDTQILVKNGDSYEPYTGANRPADGLYYYAREYYDWTNVTANEDGTYACTKKTAYIEVRLDQNSPLKQSEGYWYIQAGAYTASTLMVTGDDVTKASNDTQTSSVVAHPTRTAGADNSHYTVYLGNNGRLALTSDPAKQVSINDSTTNDDGDAVMVGDTLTYTVKAANTTGKTADIVITDAVPAGTELVSVDNGGVNNNGKITWTIQNVADGETVSVSFRVKVTEDALSNAVQYINNTATIKIGDNPEYTTNTTSNPPQGKSVTSSNPDTDDVKVGDTLTYTIQAVNNSDGPAILTITDTIPEGTVYVPGSAEHEGAVLSELDTDNDGAVDALTWVFGSNTTGVGAGVTVDVEFKVIVSAEAENPIKNTAEIKIGANGPTIKTNTTNNDMTYGDLVLTKTVVKGNANGNTGKEFILTLIDVNSVGNSNLPALNGTFTVTGSSLASNVTFVKGVAEVKIKHGETITIQDLPAGVTLTVQESAASGYTPSYSSTQVTIVADSTVDAGNKVEVTNTYNVTPIEVFLQGNKTLSGAMVTSATFSFVAQESDANGVVKAGGKLATGEATVAAGSTSAAITFGALNFDTAGTYYFCVSEVQGSLTGVTYADKVAIVKIEVVDNGDGTLSANTSVVEGTDLSFANTYKPAEIQVVLEGTKTLSGRTLIDGRYSFVVKEGETTVATGTNDASGKIVFTPITYSGTGTHTYNVYEVTGSESGVTYDKTEYSVSVNVTDEGGELKANVTYPENGIKFSNSYTPDDLLVTLTGTKEVTGERTTVKDKEFTFVVKDAAGNVVSTGTNDATGKITFNAIEYNFDDMTGVTGENHIYTKEFTYTVSEIIPDVAKDPYMDYDETSHTVKVKVTYNAVEAKWSYDVDYGTGLTFTNVQHPSSITETIVASKHLTNSDDVPGAYFSVSVYEYNNGSIGKEVAAGALSSTASKATVATLSFSQPGTYTYLVKETKAGTQGNGITYDTAAYVVTVVISLSDTGVLSKNVTYTKQDGTDIGSDGIVFHNTYNAAGYLTLRAKKELSGRTLKAGEFEFIIKDAADNVVSTGTNDANGNITFGSIYYTNDNVDFNNDGTANLTYHMREVKGTLPGVTYDEKDYTIHVTLKQSEGKITATYTIDGIDEDNVPTFTNSYAPATGDSITVSGTKTLTGRTIREGEFIFRLYHVAADGTETLVDSGAVAADGSWSITRVYPATVTPGTYNYKVVEVNNSIPGVSYDSTFYTFQVKLEDDGNGNLNAMILNFSAGTVTDDTLSGLNFANSYQPTAITFTPVVTKTLTGRTMSDNEFSFVIKDDSGSVVSTGESKADGTIAFGPIAYSEKGEHTYSISEVVGTLGGMTYDTDVINMVVTVSDDGNGKLTAAAKYYDAEGKEITPAFQNEYKTKDAAVALQATKVLTGRDMRAGEFSFVVKDSNGNVVSTGGNAAAKAGETAAITFSEIAFTQAGTYKYTVSEIVKQVGDGVKYDQASFEVTITVVDDGTGNLVASVKYPEGGIKFTNVYEPTAANVTLSAHKTLEGKVLVDNEFTFELKDNRGNTLQTVTNKADGTVAFDEIRYTAAGTYTYTIREGGPGEKAADGSYTYDPAVFTVTVQVKDDGMGKLYVESVKYEESVAGAGTSEAATIAFFNSYKPAEVYLDLDGKLDGEDVPGLDVTKTVTSTSGEKYSPAGFRFDVYNASRQIVATGISDETGKVTFYPIDANGKSFDEAGYNGDETKDLTFTAADLYRYFIVERESDKTGITIDSTYWEVHVLVGYNETTGELTIANQDVYAHVYTPISAHDDEVASEITTSVQFNNIYDPTDASLTVTLDKKLSGRDLVAGEFTFHVVEKVAELPDSDNEIEIIRAEAKNDANGKVSFNLAFDKVGTYTYYIHEHVPVSADDKGVVTYNGVKYDTSVYTLVVSVTDDGNGQLVAKVVEEKSDSSIVYENHYTASHVDVTIAASKVLTGRDLTEGEFQFKLVDTNGNNSLTHNTADGSVSYKLRYTKPGTYTYTLSEVKGDAKGIVYDETVYTVTVTVTDDLKGQLHADVQYSTIGEDGELAALAGTPTFTNGYKLPDDATVSIDLEGAQKSMTGREAAEGEFTFELVDSEGNAVATANNGVDGKILFENVTFNATGEFGFIVREVAGDVPGVAYDEHTYGITVTVEDDLQGNLVVTDIAYATDDGKIPVFINGYKGEEVTVQISADKVLEGKDMTADDVYTFELVDSEGKVVDTATNDAEGNISFSMTLADAAEYTFTVREVAGDDAHITYDDAVYTVTVTVTDKLDGYLYAEVKYGTETGSQPVFRNVYSPDAIAVTLTGTKTLTGRTMKDGEFKFEVRDSNGTLVASGSNKADGTIDFGTITLSAEGEYVFTVTEVKGDAKFVTYDDTAYTVTVGVENDNGVLKATVVYPEGGIAFENEYDNLNGAPQTGDNTPVVVLVVLVVLSAACIILLVVTRKKRGHDEE